MRRLHFPAILAAFSLAAAACSATPGGSAGPSAPTTLPEAETELDLVIWPGYAEDGSNDAAYDWVNPFQDETGCQVKTKVANDSAEMVELMSGDQYDGVSASGDATLRLIAGGLVAPVNMDLIPNYADVFEGLKGLPHNTVGGKPYGVPHGRGPNVLMYNTDTFTTAPTSWDAIWDADSPAAGKISIYDSPIFIADAALHLMQGDNPLGITDPYQLNEEQFNAAVDLLTAQHAIVGDYWSDYTAQITSFASGDMLAGTSWTYQYLYMTEGAPVAITLPEEGATGWSDTWMISSTAAHPGCMYRWMNWMISAQTNAEATVWFGEAPVSAKACEAAEALSPGHCEATHATDTAYWEKIWYWSTPRKDCNDADDSTACKSFDDWIQAWTQVTGA